MATRVWTAELPEKILWLTNQFRIYLHARRLFFFFSIRFVLICASICSTLEWQFVDAFAQIVCIVCLKCPMTLVAFHTRVTHAIAVQWCAAALWSIHSNIPNGIRSYVRWEISIKHPCSVHNVSMRGSVYLFSLCSNRLLGNGVYAIFYF